MPICPNCGTATDGDFCPECGARVTNNTPMPEPEPQFEPQPAPQQFTPPQQFTQPQPAQQFYGGYQAPVNVNAVQREMTVDDLPAKFKPLSPWAYFGYSLLFAIPIVGFILLIVFSCKDTNRNRRNYARSFWCGLIIAAIIVGIIFIIALALGTSFGGVFDELFH